MDRLPPEVLCEVFGWCVEPYQTVLPKEAPLVLLSVCKHWREVALAHSHLWTGFSIQISDAKPIPETSLIQRWTQAAGINDMTVSIKVEGSDPFSYSALHSARPILEYLDRSQSVTQWKVATLALPAAESFLKGLFRHSHPLRLESLHVAFNGWDIEGIKHLSNFFSRAPKLKQLEWSDGDFYGIGVTSTASFLLTTNIPWGNLTRLVLNVHTSLTTTYQILSQCDSLQTLELSRFADNKLSPEERPELKPFRLPCLQSMTLRQRVLDKGLRSLFDRLSVPNLQHIHIDAKIDVERWSNEAFISLLKRSDVSLMSICLEYVAISESELLQLLELSPTLTTLEVRSQRGEICISDVVLAKLTVPARGGKVLEGFTKERDVILCPVLKKMVLSRCIDCSNGALARMLKTRGWGEKSGCEPGCARMEIVDVRFPMRGQQNPVDVSSLEDAVMADCEAPVCDF
ncbi:hypothetical protein NP233_g4947 [Leucocoprinus birnbaumii]|uniref:F-box domain-containing protein n=1 Tax=Leucocoprinus birnbaumii TaxID=56174 RepID=A0AAD5VWG3_9AGAR|nr:hypothetical protein NP233_g4947 [Leucocoprinus birnbaumii]